MPGPESGVALNPGPGGRGRMITTGGIA